MANNVKIIGKAEKVNIKEVKLRKGMLLGLDGGQYGIVTATRGDKLEVTDITFVVGNYWGDAFDRGMTVGEFNRTRYTQIETVYNAGSFEITIDLGGQA